jgi:hypothetical protein
MFGDNIIPDDMLDGFYDNNKYVRDTSNNLVDVSNNLVQIKPIQKNIIYGGGGGRIQYLIRPIDRDGNMIKKFYNKYNLYG